MQGLNLKQEIYETRFETVNAKSFANQKDHSALSTPHKNTLPH